MATISSTLSETEILEAKRNFWKSLGKNEFTENGKTVYSSELLPVEPFIVPIEVEKQTIEFCGEEIEIEDYNFLLNSFNVETEYRPEIIETPKQSNRIFDTKDEWLDELEKEFGKSSVYIVIHERVYGEGYDVYLNKDFPCRGGRLVNDKVENQFGAKKLAQILHEKLNKSEIVKIDANITLAPTDRVKIEEPPVMVPDIKLTPKSAIFQMYVRVALLKKNKKPNIDINYLGKWMANKYNRTWGPRFARVFLEQINRLRKHARTDGGMKFMCKKLFGIEELPDMGTLTIPAREETIINKFDVWGNVLHSNKVEAAPHNEIPKYESPYINEEKIEHEITLPTNENSSVIGKQFLPLELLESSAFCIWNKDSKMVGTVAFFNAIPMND